MGDRVRVAIVLPTYFPNGLDFIGGGDRYAYRVAEALRPMCDVTFVTFGPRASESDAGGLRHVTVKANGSDPENPVPSIGFFLRERFDVLHVFQLRAMATSLLALLTRVRPTPLVVTDIGGGGRSLMFRLQLYRFVDRFICISDFSRSLLPASTRARAVAVHGGLDLARFEFWPGERKRQVLQVSRIMPHKGMNYLIDAAGADIPVVIAGRVKDPAYLEHLRTISRGKQVTIITDADDDHVLELYRTSAITVGPSVYRDVWGGSWPTSELLGLTMLESMAVGTPVVCTNVGGMPEYVVEGTTGFVVPPNDKDALRDRISRLLSDHELAATMGRAAREHVLQYSWDQVAQRVEAVYRELLHLEARDRESPVRQVS